MARITHYVIVLLSAVYAINARCPLIDEATLPENAEKVKYQPADRFDPIFEPSRGQRNRGLPEGYGAVVICLENFTLVPHQGRVCQEDDTWTTINGALEIACAPDGTNCRTVQVQQKCIAIRCYHPVPCQYSSISPSQAFYNSGQVITYSCSNGLLAYPSSDRTCEASGQWSGLDTQCVTAADFTRLTNRQCVTLEPPVFGFILGAEGLNHVDDEQDFACFGGTTMLGSHKRVCQDDLEWSGEQPTCVRGLDVPLPEGDDITETDRLIPDVASCRHFYHYSIDGDLFHKICPSDLYFNEEKKVCDYQDRSGCSNEVTIDNP